MIDFFIRNKDIIIHIGAIVGLGIPLTLIITRLIQNALKKKINKHVSIVVSNALFYGSLLIIAISILHEFGFHITALLGAAGIVGIAIGFAAQTSIANIISGIFIIGERSFSIGDIIGWSSFRGTVDSIDLLSVKIKTSDNTLLCVPNELLIKQVISNYSILSPCRLEFVTHVPLSEKNNLQKIISLLRDVIHENNLCFDEPAREVFVEEITKRSIRILLQVWVKRQHIEILYHSFIMQCYEELIKENIAVLKIAQKK